MSTGLAGKVALVTGGGSGIGRAICLRLAEEGSRVGVADIRPQSAVETVALRGERSGELVAIECDITSPSAGGGRRDFPSRTLGADRCPGEQRRLGQNRAVPPDDTGDP
ncbi:MAG: SDR family NAD(P)-dependent oxidoreductase [Dehalococcoidia bacterium]|nr:SDR family NAD(P)-dependent oxidoreductase [Dehalococcoidia bacterium]